MYKQKKLRKLGKKTSHRSALVRNQLRSLFEGGKVETTSPKAKVLKANAESIIAKAKNSSDALVLRRDLRVTLGNADLIKKFMEYAAKEDAGVSIVKVGFRSGDNAEVSRVELLGMKKKVKKVVKEEVKEEKKVEIEKTEKIDIEKRSAKKSIDKTVVMKKTEKAKSRSGL